MILYHFTTIEFLGPDPQPGTVELDRELSIGEVPMRDGSTGNAVWLTTDPGVWSDGSQQTCPRIKVRVPSADRKLIGWHRWARREDGAAQFDSLFEDFAATLQRRGRDIGAGEVRRSTGAWWMYWGAIPPGRFVAAEWVRG